MRPYIENFRAPTTKIRFGGLDTRHSQLFTKQDMSPDMMNIDLRPVGGCRKRDGLSEGSYDVPGSGDVHRLVSLNTLTNVFLYAVRDTTIYGTTGPSVAWTTIVDATLSVGGKGRCEHAFFVDEDVSDDATNWEYYNSSAYIVTGVDEPQILFPDLTPGSQGAPWPEGAYSATPATAKRGYPDFWKDITGTAVPSWPSGLYYAGDPSQIESALHDATYNRMFAYGFHLDPDRIDYSQLGVPYNMLHADVSSTANVDPIQDGGSFYCMRGDGDRVIGVRQLADTLVVFKQHKTCLYFGTIGIDFGLVNVIPVGAVSDDSIVQVGNDIYFWSEGGPRSLSGVIKYGSINEFGISDDIRGSTQSISVDSLSDIHGRFEREFNRVVWHVGLSSSTIDHCFVYYLPEADDPEGRWSQWDGLYADLIAVATVTPVSSPLSVAYGLSSGGRFFTLNSGPVDADENIAAYYITRWMDLSVLTIDKRLLALTAVFDDEGRGGSKLEYGLDYNEFYVETGHELKNLGGGGVNQDLWNQSVWDDPEFTWSSSGKSVSRYGLTGLGFVLRFKISDDSGFPFSISGMALDVSFKGKV